MAVAAEPAPAGPIVSPGPLTKILGTEVLTCQVYYDDDPQFYPARPCYTNVYSEGIMSGWNNRNDPTWEPESQELTGSGTRDDPFELRTVVTGNDWKTEKIDRYITGRSDYDSQLRVTNQRSNDRTAIVSHMADCFGLGAHNYGYGAGDAATGTVSCSKNPPAVAETGQMISFVPKTPHAEFAYGVPGQVYFEAGWGHPFGNRMLFDGGERTDNGMGISWNAHVAAGATETFEWRNQFHAGGTAAANVALDLTLEDDNKNGRADANEPVRITASVTNTGSMALRDGKITDDLGALFTCPVEIEGGSSEDCTATHRLTQSEIDSDQLDESVSFTAKTPAGSEYAADAVHATLERLRVESGNTSTHAAGSDPLVGESLPIDIVVNNTGNTTLSDIEVRVNDEQAATIDSLAPGESQPSTITRTVTQDDVNAGVARFQTTASGRSPAGDAIVLDPSDAAVDITQHAAAGLSMQPTIDGPLPGVGDTIGLRVDVTNDGNVTLHDPIVTTGGDYGMQFRCPATLAPGTRTSCSTQGAYSVTQADVDRGSVEFTATLAASAPNNQVVETYTSTRQKTASGIANTAPTLAFTGSGLVGLPLALALLTAGLALAFVRVSRRRMRR
ncbi:MAG TPA: hypothetical protein VNJ54_16845 [Plantibacter sp.]|uniref:DUF7507 domain-containing protein n=1 Tax=Plantibacter sp. TaxID=1871045 RepID=UPI002C4762F8|nr:hypothetical protein [Plantibacter sp.]